ncbi:MAG: FecR domain-containing protein [Armatimonadota bacterium]|nr:MAG: FecR domain-containing protein [Armatimonadota bacterium]
MRRAATALIFGFALLMIFWVYMMHTLTIVQRLAVVDVVEGRAEVLVHGRGDPVPLEVGRLVRAGDLVRTGPGSAVELRWVGWAGGMRIRIDHDTRFWVTRSIINKSAGEGEARLRVDLGKVWLRLRQALTGKSKFEVETPTVVAAVRGTVFSVAVTGDGTSEIEVFEGKVGIAGRDGAATTLTAGSRTAIAPGQQTVETQPLTPEELDEWQKRACLIGPFLEVASPTDGVLLDEASCAVSGRAEPGSQVFVNGSRVELSKKGEFSVTVPLAAGVNTIVVTARDAANREVTVVRTVPRVADLESDEQ